jgi:CRP-like cAMP-binding protein
MASPNVDTRKLKDQVAEYLRKQKYDKAAETLELLIRGEPKDMQHRLKLGDTYRRIGVEEKAITCYQVAAKHFSDEGQLIKAIGAVKVILEIDPKNQMAQRELAEMNDRRFAKPTLESAGLKTPKGIGAGARGVSEIELAESEKAAAEIGSLLEESSRDTRFDSPGAEDDEPLELDDGPKTPIKPGIKAPIAPVYMPPKVAQRGVVASRTPGPAPVRRPTIELGGGDDMLGLDGPIEAELEPLDDEMVLEPSRQAPVPSAPKPAPARPAAPPRKPDAPPAQRLRVTEAQPVSIDLEPEVEEVMELPDDAIVEIETAAQLATGKPPPRPPLVAAAPPRPPPIAPPPPPRKLEEEIDLDLIQAPASRPAAARQVTTPPPPVRPHVTPPARPVGPPQPIADLLSGQAEEEIELLSISSDQELPPPRPPPPPLDEITPDGDVDAAFGAIGKGPIVPPQPPPPPRVPLKVPLFDDLSQEAFVALVNKVSYRRWAPGELILKEGDPGRSFFVIVEGRVRVYKQLDGGRELELARLGEGAFFGEMALLSGAPRTANVAAEEETELLEVTDTVLREVVQEHPGVATSLKNFYRQRLLNNVMTISPMFKDFDPGERKSVVERFKMRQAAPGEVFITEGKNSDGLYVVLHGQVRVVKKNDEGMQFELARLKEGDLFGEMSLLTRQPATATVTATGNTIVLKLPRENFQELILTHPQILELVSELTDQRKSATEAVLSGQGPGHDGMSFV